MTIAVPIVAGTAIRGVAATLMMRQVLRRHPNAFLITLAAFGVTIPLHRSQEHLARDIRAGLEAMGRDPGNPVVLVGHSQGGLAVLRYAIDHQQLTSTTPCSTCSAQRVASRRQQARREGAPPEGSAHHGRTSVRAARSAARPRRATGRTRPRS